MSPPYPHEGRVGVPTFRNLRVFLSDGIPVGVSLFDPSASYYIGMTL